LVGTFSPLTWTQAVVRSACCRVYFLQKKDSSPANTSASVGRAHPACSVGPRTMHCTPVRLAVLCHRHLLLLTTTQHQATDPNNPLGSTHTAKQQAVAPNPCRRDAAPRGLLTSTTNKAAWTRDTRPLRSLHTLTYTRMQPTCFQDVSYAAHFACQAPLMIQSQTPPTAAA
jgi:hypothetical protein